MAPAPRRILLADGAPPAALAAARSLVLAGLRVEASRGRTGDRAPASRGVVPFACPSPAADSAGFAQSVQRRASGGDRPLLLPCSEAAVLALESRRAEIEASSDLLLPPPAVLQRALDKRRTLEAARAAGVPAPRTFEAARPGDADACPLGPPLVVKPSSSRWSTAGGRIAGAGPAFVAERSGLRGVLEGLFAAGAPGALVQEWVPGTGWGAAVLLRGGAPAAVFVHRRLRELHPAGGPSSAAVSEPPDPALLDPAVALLRAMEWEGLAMVEFRRDGTGAPVLMEVNGRPWGTLGLAVDAGVDFPRLLVEGRGGPPPAYRAGVRRRWLAGDLRRAATAWRGPPPGYPGRFPSAARAFADVVLGAAPDLVFRWSDPGPFFAEIRGALS